MCDFTSHVERQQDERQHVEIHFKLKRSTLQGSVRGGRRVGCGDARGRRGLRGGSGRRRRGCAARRQRRPMEKVYVYTHCIYQIKVEIWRTYCMAITTSKAGTAGHTYGAYYCKDRKTRPQNQDPNACSRLTGAPSQTSSIPYHTSLYKDQ